MLAIGNLESLFSVDADVAMPLYEDVVIGLMVIRPNLDIYRDMVTTLSALASEGLIRQDIRSVDQTFQHAFWWFRGLREAGYARFDQTTGIFLHCNVEDNIPSLEDRNLVTHYISDIQLRKDPESGSTKPRIAFPNKPYIQKPRLSPSNNLTATFAAERIFLRAYTDTIADQIGIQSSRKSDIQWNNSLFYTPKYKFCALSLEYHLSVTYPQLSRILQYPERYVATSAGITLSESSGSADTESDAFGSLSGQSALVQDLNVEISESEQDDSSHLIIDQRGTDLILRTLADPIKFSRLLHWPGEKRKPWIHCSTVARTPFDDLWWAEHYNVFSAVQERLRVDTNATIVARHEDHYFVPFGHDFDGMRQHLEIVC